MKFTTQFKINTIRHQIAATARLITSGIKRYIIQLIELENKLEILENTEINFDTLPVITNKIIKTIKGEIHFTATEIKSIRQILMSGLLTSNNTNFKLGRKYYSFINIKNNVIKVKIEENRSFSWKQEMYTNVQFGTVVLNLQ